jgi:hypothetical protein
MSDKKVSVPSSVEDSSNATSQTISSTPNKQKVTDAAPLVEGPDAVGHWVGDGTNLRFEK